MSGSLLIAITLQLTLAPPVRAQDALSSMVSEWKHEALFDSTTTRAELMEMGRAGLGMSHFPLAEIYFQEVLLRDPNDVEAMLELAALYRRTGRLEYARGLLTRAGLLAPGRYAIVEARRAVEAQLVARLTHQVDSLLVNGRFDEALPRVAILLSIDNRNVDALADKARCLAVNGDTDGALSSIQLAISLDPSDELHRMRDEISAQHEQARIAELETSARRLLDSGDWVRGEAIEVLQAILAHDPSNEWARERFRALSEATAPAEPAPRPAAPREVFDAMRDVAPGVATVVARHLPAILAVMVLLIVAQSPLTRSLARRLKEPSPLAGDLTHITVSDALRVASTSALTGTIVFRTPDGPAKVFLDSGEPIHCVAFGKHGLDAISALVRDVEAGTFEFRSRRVRVERTINRSLDMILADDGATGMEAASRRRKKSRMSELLESNVD